MPAKLLRLYGRNLLHHLGALVGALVPIVVQLTSHAIGWVPAEALSTGVIVTWLLANAHVTGKLAASIASDLQGIVGGTGGGSPDLGRLIGEVSQMFGLGDQQAQTAAGSPLAGMKPPPGMGALFPSGAPADTATVVQAPPAAQQAPPPAPPGTPTNVTVIPGTTP